MSVMVIMSDVLYSYQCVAASPCARGEMARRTPWRRVKHQRLLAAIDGRKAGLLARQ